MPFIVLINLFWLTCGKTNIKISKSHRILWLWFCKIFFLMRHERLDFKWTQPLRDTSTCVPWFEWKVCLENKYKWTYLLLLDKFYPILAFLLCRYDFILSKVYIKSFPRSFSWEWCSFHFSKTVRILKQTQKSWQWYKRD